jgi:thioesterase domain-containing protein
MVNTSVTKRVVVLPGLSGSTTEIGPLLTALGTHDTTIVGYPDWPSMRRTQLNKATFLAHCRKQLGSPHNTTFFGYSFGGLVAFALAADLLEAGHSTPVIGLLDAQASSALREPPPGPFPVRAVRAARNGVAIDRLWYRLGETMIRHPASWPLDLAATTPSTTKLWLAIQCNFTWSISEELQTWMAGITTPLPLHAVLFRCTKQEPGVPDDLGWRAFIQHVQVIDIPGDHAAITRPSYGPILAAHIKLAGAFT